MRNLSEAVRADLRRIGGELSRLNFEVLTVTGIDDQDDLSQKRLTQAMDFIDQAIQHLAEIITDDQLAEEGLADDE